MKLEEAVLVACCVDYVMSEELTPESLEALVMDMFKANGTPIEKIPTEPIKKTIETFCEHNQGGEIGRERIHEVINLVGGLIVTAEHLNGLFEMFRHPSQEDRAQ